MLKDKIMVGVIVGLLADAVKLIVNYILYLLDLTQVVFWQIVATLIVEKSDLHVPLTYLIGAIADFTVTAGLGVVFIYLIKYIGNKYLWIKGIGFGMFVWVSLFGTLLGQSVHEKLPQTPSGILVTIIAHFFFGLSLAIFTKLLYHSKKRT